MAHLDTGLNTVSLVPFSTRPSRFRRMSMVGSIISNASNNAERQRNGDADLSSFLIILNRNIWKILAATLLSLMLAGIYLAIAKPMYTASASLFIDPRNRKVVSDEVAQGGYGTDLALVESQASIITSDEVLKRVVHKLHLADDPDYAPAYGQSLLSKIKRLVIKRAAPPDPATLALNSLADSIKVKRAQKTYVVDLEVTASTPTKAAGVAAAVLDAYLADQTAAESEQAKRANALIDARLGELREQVRVAETRSDDYKRSNKLLTSEGGAVTEQQLTKLNGELATARAVTAENKARYDQVQLALKSPDGSAVLPDAIRSGLIQKLREQYAQVARREAALASQLQSRHPVLIEVRSQLAAVKTQINAELQRIATAAESEYQIALNRERDIGAQLEKAKEEVRRANTAQIKARELEQDVATSRQLMGVFLQRAKETQEQQNISTPDARVITPPSVPTRPSKPLTLLILGLGLIGGLGLGVAWALASDHLDGSMHSAAEFGEATGLAAISAIPALRGSSSLVLRGSKQTVEVPRSAQFRNLLLAIADTKGEQATAYRQAVLRLLATIKNHQRPGRPHTVMMVSPRTGAGNSATALAVGYAAALAGDRVLLIDATSVNPELSTIFATTLKPTNIVVLDSKDHLNRITTRDTLSGLAFLPIALADLRSLKTQQRRRLVAGLNGLSQNYDLVIIDAGGVLEDESVTSLVPAADRLMIVAHAGVTTRDDVAKTLQILEPARDRIAGGVLTMLRGQAV
jgi:succinoglycan biosynthesis transport protein ExoP